MPLFFIDRPVFAWVIALFIVLAGVSAIPQLPVMQYPDVAPPQVEIVARYPGASAQDMDQSVVSLIEQELNGASNLLYFTSQSSLGQAVVTASFEPGTSADLAQVDVQNRLKSIESRLPAAVVQQGLEVQKTSSGFLAMVTLTATADPWDNVALNDYLARNVVNEVRRLKGVGKVQLYGAERAMRVWIDMRRLQAFNLTPADVNRALLEQNAQVAAGSLGDLPGRASQDMTAALLVKGQLDTPAQFAGIVLRANTDGSTVLLGDVAKVEVGSQEYQYSTRLNGHSSAAFSVQLAPGANALETSTRVRARMDELSRYFSAGVKYDIPYDTAPFVKVSITKVLYTLIEAMALVFIVMFVFLQNIRYTLIPAVVVPVALLGTVALMLALGFSINVLTMSGMVLAIGILVDDAIVVVENVERIMTAEGLSPKDATRKAMGQITGAIIGITLVLTAVFVPLAFMKGSVGIIYRQFSLSMATAILCSAFLALTLTPALCATLLKPSKQDRDHRHGYWDRFNGALGRFTERYVRWVRHALRRRATYLWTFAVICLLLGIVFARLPSSFLPMEDQGYVITDIQLPPGASVRRTLEVAQQVEEHNAREPGVENTTLLLGFSFSGTGQNAALAITTFKDWARRGAKDSAQAIVDRANLAFSSLRDAVAYSILPPPVDGVGTSSGFELMLQDRGGLGYAALIDARDQLLRLARQDPGMSDVRENALAQSPQVQLEIDRTRANALGVGFADIGALLATAVGSTYVNDFPNQGRMQRVVVQAQGDQRSQVEDVLNITVRNSVGKMLPLAAVVQVHWKSGPMQLTRYNGYPAVNISGSAASGRTTGQAMQRMEQLVATLPAGIGLEWTGLSRQEQLSGSQAPWLLGLALLVVFLCLAALYESWSIPAAVVLIIPLGVIGATLAVTLRGMPNDVFFKVGLITTMGLAAKNAILIVDVARHLHGTGQSLADAAIQAARLRLRPIIMTSLAFILGVVPLVFASGAGSAALQAIGTGVIGGMISATVAVVFVPLFYVSIVGWGSRGATPAEDSSPAVALSDESST